MFSHKQRWDRSRVRDTLQERETGENALHFARLILHRYKNEQWAKYVPRAGASGGLHSCTNSNRNEPIGSQSTRKMSLLFQNIDGNGAQGRLPRQRRRKASIDKSLRRHQCQSWPRLVDHRARSTKDPPWAARQTSSLSAVRGSFAVHSTSSRALWPLPSLSSSCFSPPLTRL